MNGHPIKLAIEIVFLLFILPMAIALGFGYISTSIHNRHIQDTWGRTEGIITDIDTRTYNGYSVKYKYQVGGEDYTGAGYANTSISEGTSIQVYYDPVEPGKSKAWLKPYEPPAEENRAEKP